MYSLLNNLEGNIAYWLQMTLIIWRLRNYSTNFYGAPNVCNVPCWYKDVRVYGILHTLLDDTMNFRSRRKWIQVHTIYHLILKVNRTRQRKIKQWLFDNSCNQLQNCIILTYLGSFPSAFSTCLIAAMVVNKINFRESIQNYFILKIILKKWLESLLHPQKGQHHNPVRPKPFKVTSKQESPVTGIRELAPIKGLLVERWWLMKAVCLELLFSGLK